MISFHVVIDPTTTVRGHAANKYSWYGTFTRRSQRAVIALIFPRDTHYSLTGTKVGIGLVEIYIKASSHLPFQTQSRKVVQKALHPDSS